MLRELDAKTQSENHAQRELEEAWLHAHKLPASTSLKQLEELEHEMVLRDMEQQQMEQGILKPREKPRWGKADLRLRAASFKQRRNSFDASNTFHEILNSKRTLPGSMHWESVGYENPDYQPDERFAWRREMSLRKDSFASLGLNESTMDLRKQGSLYSSHRFKRSVASSMLDGSCFSNVYSAFVHKPDTMHKGATVYLHTSVVRALQALTKHCADGLS